MRPTMSVLRRNFALPLVLLALASVPAFGAPSLQRQDVLADRLRWPQGQLSLAALTRALMPALRHRIPSGLLPRASVPPAPARVFLDDAIIYDDFEDTARYHDADKRQYPDYGHLRFGKRAEFGDYGHLRFGRSKDNPHQDAADRQDKDNYSAKRTTRQRLDELKTMESNLSPESR